MTSEPDQQEVDHSKTIGLSWLKAEFGTPEEPEDYFFETELTGSVSPFERLMRDVYGDDSAGQRYKRGAQRKAGVKLPVGFNTREEFESYKAGFESLKSEYEGQVDASGKVSGWTTGSRQSTLGAGRAAIAVLGTPTGRNDALRVESYDLSQADEKQDAAASAWYAGQQAYLQTVTDTDSWAHMFTSTAPGIALSLLSPVAGATYFAAQSAGTASSEYDTKVLAGEFDYDQADAALFSGITASIEFAAERISLGTMRGLGRGVAGRLFGKAGSKFAEKSLAKAASKASEAAARAAARGVPSTIAHYLAKSAMVEGAEEGATSLLTAGLRPIFTQEEHSQWGDILSETMHSAAAGAVMGMAFSPAFAARGAVDVKMGEWSANKQWRKNFNAALKRNQDIAQNSAERIYSTADAAFETVKATPVEQRAALLESLEAQAQEMGVSFAGAVKAQEEARAAVDQYGDGKGQQFALLSRQLADKQSEYHQAKRDGDEEAASVALGAMVKLSAGLSALSEIGSHEGWSSASAALAEAAESGKDADDAISLLGQSYHDYVAKRNTKASVEGVEHSESVHARLMNAEDLALRAQESAITAHESHRAGQAANAGDIEWTFTDAAGVIAGRANRGVTASTAQTNVDNKAAQFVKNILGLNVEFFEGGEGAPAFWDARTPDTIYLRSGETDSRKAISLAVHEGLHYLQITDPTTYRLVRNVLNGEDILQSALDYAKKGGDPQAKDLALLDIADRVVEEASGGEPSDEMQPSDRMGLLYAELEGTANLIEAAGLDLGTSKWALFTARLGIRGRAAMGFARAVKLIGQTAREQQKKQAQPDGRTQQWSPNVNAENLSMFQALNEMGVVSRVDTQAQRELGALVARREAEGAPKQEAAEEAAEAVTDEPTAEATQEAQEPQEPSVVATEDAVESTAGEDAGDQGTLFARDRRTASPKAKKLLEGLSKSEQLRLRAAGNRAARLDLDRWAATNWIAAMETSEHATTLTIPSIEDALAVDENGDALYQVFQIPGLETGYALHRIREDGFDGWEVTGVINNEGDISGVADIIIGHAVTQNTDLPLRLDAFDVTRPGAQFGEGKLPALYMRNGFAFYDKVDYGLTFSNNEKLAAQIKAWQKDGWEPEYDYPDGQIPEFDESVSDRRGEPGSGGTPIPSNLPSLWFGKLESEIGQEARDSVRRDGLDRWLDVRETDDRPVRARRSTSMERGDETAVEGVQRKGERRVQRRAVGETQDTGRTRPSDQSVDQDGRGDRRESERRIRGSTRGSDAKSARVNLTKLAVALKAEAKDYSVPKLANMLTGIDLLPAQEWFDARDEWEEKAPRKKPTKAELKKGITVGGPAKKGPEWKRFKELADAHVRQFGFTEYGKVSRIELQKYLEMRTQAAFAEMERSEEVNDPRFIELISTAMSKEIVHAFNSGEMDATDWYQQNIKDMFDELSKSVPELAPSHPNVDENRIAFSILLAVLSNGAAVDENMGHAVKAFRQHIKTGKVPKVPSTHRKSGALDVAFSLYEHLGSWKAVDEWLSHKGNMGDIKADLKSMQAELKAAGFDVKMEVSGETNESVGWRSFVLGPKLGSFYLNLRGNFDPLTMDVWWMRSVGRLIGRIMAPVGESERSTVTKVRQMNTVFKRTPKATVEWMLKEIDKAIALRTKDLNKHKSVVENAKAKIAAAKEAIKSGKAAGRSTKSHEEKLLVAQRRLEKAKRDVSDVSNNIKSTKSDRDKVSTIGKTISSATEPQLKKLAEMTKPYHNKNKHMWAVAIGRFHPDHRTVKDVIRTQTEVLKTANAAIKKALDAKAAKNGKGPDPKEEDIRLARDAQSRIDAAKEDFNNYRMFGYTPSLVKDGGFPTWVQESVSLFEQNKYKEPDPVRKAFITPVNTLRKNTRASKDTPSSGGDRLAMREMMTVAVAKANRVLKKGGFPPLDNASGQALEWYFEKGIYHTFLTGKNYGSPTGQDFAQAASEVTLEAREGVSRFEVSYSVVERATFQDGKKVRGIPRRAHAVIEAIDKTDARRIFDRNKRDGEYTKVEMDQRPEDAQGVPSPRVLVKSIQRVDDAPSLEAREQLPISELRERGDKGDVEAARILAKQLRSDAKDSDDPKVAAALRAAAKSIVSEANESRLERANLKKKLAAQRTAAGIGFREGMAVGRQRVKQALYDERERAAKRDEKAQKRNLKIRLRAEEKAANLAHMQLRRDMAQIKRAVMSALTAMPMKLRGKFLGRALKANSLDDVTKIAQEVHDATVSFEAQAARNDIKKLQKRMRKRGMTNKARDAIVEQLDMALGLLTGANNRLIQLESTTELTKRLSRAKDLVESAIDVYMEERRAWKDDYFERKDRLQEQRNELVGNIQAHGEPRKPKALASIKNDPNIVARVWQESLDPDGLFESIEGKDSVLRRSWNGIRSAKGRMWTQKREIERKIDEALKRAGYEDKDDFLARATDMYGEGAAEQLTVTLGGEEMTITVSDALGLAAMDDETFDSLPQDERAIIEEDKKGPGIVFRAGSDRNRIQATQDEVLIIRESLGEEHMQLIQDLKDILESDIRAKVFDIHWMQHGKQPPVVKNYWPRARKMSDLGDDLVGDSFTAPDPSGPSPSNLAVNSMLDNAGFTKARTGGGAALIIGGLLNVFDQHIEDSLMLIHLSRPLRDFDGLLRDENVSDAIVSRLGDSGIRRIREQLAYAIGLTGRTAGRDVFGMVQSNIAGAYLVASVKTWVRMLGGGFRILSEIKTDAYLKGLTNVENLTPGARGRLITDIEEQSGYFYERHRRSQVGRYSNLLQDPRSQRQFMLAFAAFGRSLRNSGEDNAANGVKRVINIMRATGNLAKGMLSVMRGFDHALRGIDRQIMLVAVQGHMAEGLSFEAAVDAAEMTFRRTQNTSDSSDDVMGAARIKGGNQQIMKQLLLFSSDPMKAHNQIRTAWRDRAEDPGKAARTVGAIGLNSVLSSYVGYMFAGTLFSLFDDDEEDSDRDIMSQAAMETEGHRAKRRMVEEAMSQGGGAIGWLASMAVYGIDSALNGRYSSSDPVELASVSEINDLLHSGINVIRKTSEDELTPGDVGSAALDAMTIVGLPFEAIARIIGQVDEAMAEPDPVDVLSVLRARKREGTLTRGQKKRLEELEAERKAEQSRARRLKRIRERLEAAR